MKTLIFYGSYGGGHVAAANSIKDYIESNYPEINIKTIDCIEYISKSINKISTSAYKEITKKSPKLWKHLYYKTNNPSTLSSFSNISCKLMAIKLRKFINQEKPDLIISTHPFSSQICAYIKKKYNLKYKLATIMTDYHIHFQWFYLPDFVDYFFVANKNMKEDLKNHKIDDSKIFVTGLPFSPRFKTNFNKEKIYEQFWLDNNKKTVLLFCGGEFGLGDNTSYMVLKSLIRLFPNIQVIAISGKNKKIFENFENLIEKTNSGDRVKLFKFTELIPELMSISEFVVTKPGGMTVTESLISNLPIIIINPIPGQEEENAEFLVNSNCAVWIKDDQNISRTLKNLQKNPDILKDLKENIKKIAKPNATQNICDKLILDIYKQTKTEIL